MLARLTALAGFNQVPVAAGGGGGGSPLTVDAVYFDETDAVGKTSALTGAADGKKLTVSKWFYFDNAADASTDYLFSARQSSGKSPPRGGVYRSTTGSGGKLAFFWTQAGAGVDAVGFTSTDAVPASSAWNHLAISIDLTDTGKRHVMLNGSSVAGSWGAYVNTNMDFTIDQWAAAAEAPGSGARMLGGLAEVFFHLDYIDLSVAANLQKFRTSGGKPADLGADGSTPFGVQPLVYLHIDDGETADNFKLNAGSGGDFTVTGALTTYGSSPSD